METESSTLERLAAEQSLLDRIHQAVDTLIGRMIEQKRQNGREFEAQGVFRGGEIGRFEKTELERLSQEIGQRLYKRSDELGVVSFEMPITEQMVESIDGLDPNVLKNHSLLLERNYQARVRYHPENRAVEVVVERKPIEISPDGRMRKYRSSGSSLKPVTISYYV